MIAKSTPTIAPCQELPPWDLWGYSRASSDSQSHSVGRQTKDIATKAMEIVPHLGVQPRFGAWIQSNILEDDGVSAKTVPHADRPGFRRLMELCKPGDHLIVWRWDRIDRDFFTCMEAFKWMRDTPITLHVLIYKNGQPINFRESMESLIAVIMAWFGEHENEEKTEASVRGKNYRKALGTYIHGSPIPGSKLIWREGKRAYQHDEAERVLCREIATRVYWGTMRGKRAICGIRAVWLDFTARGELTADGNAWSEDRIGKVAAWMLGCVERKLEPWADCTPYTFELAKVIL